jgi:hypothetical protein
MNVTDAETKTLIIKILISSALTKKQPPPPLPTEYLVSGNKYDGINVSVN